MEPNLWLCLLLVMHIYCYCYSYSLFIFYFILFYYCEQIDIHEQILTDMIFCFCFLIFISKFDTITMFCNY